MKIRNIIAGIFLTTIMGVGLFVGVNSNINKAEEARADVWPENPTVYFAPSTGWSTYGTSFTMHYWNSDNTGNNGDVDGTLMTDTYSGRKIYKFVATDSKWPNSVQFIEKENGVEKNRSGNIKLHDNYYQGVNLLIMDTSEWNGWTTSTSGVYWMNTNDFIFKATECNTPSSLTTRIFVYNSNTHWASGGKTCVRAWGGSATKTLWSDGGTAKTANSLYNLTWFQDDNGTYYGYCDIPLNSSGFQLAEFTAEDDVAARQVTDTYKSQDLNFNGFSDCVIYCPAEGNTVSAGKAHDKVCGAALLTKVLEAIGTCSDNDYNGYNAAGRLNYHFYNDGETQIATSAAQNATVTTLGGSSAMACSDIMTAILARDNANSNQVNYLSVLGLFNNNGNTTMIMIIVVTSVVVLSAIGGYFFFRKKKEN